MELIVSSTDYDRIMWQRTSWCNYYGFLLVFVAALDDSHCLFRLVCWVDCGSHGVGGHGGAEDTRNDMTFLIHSFGKVWSHYFTVFGETRTKEMFGGVMD
jgi:hypothetical protein